jgi:hypothetical protein
MAAGACVALALLWFLAMGAVAQTVEPVPPGPTWDVPSTLVIGSTITVASPCALAAGQVLRAEFSPKFVNPTYYLSEIQGPTQIGEPVSLEVPADAVPGDYALGGECNSTGTRLETRGLAQVDVHLVVGQPTTGSPRLTG